MYKNRIKRISEISHRSSYRYSNETRASFSYYPISPEAPPCTPRVTGHSTQASVEIFGPYCIRVSERKTRKTRVTQSPLKRKRTTRRINNTFGKVHKASDRRNSKPPLAAPLS